MGRLMLAGLLAIHGAGSLLLAHQPPPTYLRSLVKAKDADSAREDIPTQERLTETINRVGRAFELGDAEELEECLQRTSGIRVSLKSRGDEAGYYRQSQVRFMFAKLFRERATESFTYDPAQLDSADDRSFHVHARWSYVVLDDDEEVTEHLRFKLERRNEDWRISEIRTVPR